MFAKSKPLDCDAGGQGEATFLSQQQQVAGLHPVKDVLTFGQRVELLHRWPVEFHSQFLTMLRLRRRSKRKQRLKRCRREFCVAPRVAILNLFHFFFVSVLLYCAFAFTFLSFALHLRSRVSSSAPSGIKLRLCFQCQFKIISLGRRRRRLSRLILFSSSLLPLWPRRRPFLVFHLLCWLRKHYC